MMVVSIGEAAARVLQRTATMMAFQKMLSRCPTAENRKRLIAAAVANGAVDEDEGRLLMRGGRA